MRIVFAAGDRRFGPITRIVAVAYVVAGAIAALSPPGPLPAGVGLDPAWTVAISRAAAAHMVFGRDIVFTYGPLGYLVTTIADRGNYVHMVVWQLAVATLILAMVVERLREPASPYQKALLAVCAPLAMANSPFEIWPPFLVLLAVTRRNAGDRNEPFVMFAIGSFSGVMSLTKFSTGIDTGLIAGAYFVARSLVERGTLAQLTRVALSEAIFAGGFFAASEAAFLAVDDGSALASGLGLVALSAIGVTAVRARRAEGTMRSRESFAIAAALFVVAVVAGSSPSYRAFVGTSIAVSLAYSDAMALVGPAWQVMSAQFLLAACAVAAISFDRAGAAGACGLLAYEWAMFKLGFVRQDLHVLNFLAGSLFGAALLAYRAPNRVAALASGTVLIASISMFANECRAAGMPPLFAAFAPSSLARKFEDVANVRADARDVDALDVVRLKADELPATVLRAIGTRPVDIVPDEATYAFANGLNWDPEPALETFVASRPALDALEAQSLERRHDDAILYTFGSIDGRYPVGDEPLAFRYTLCNYRVAGSFVPALLGDVFLLLRDAATRCGPLELGPVATVRWNEPLAIPHRPGHLTFARIMLDPNLAGRAYSFAFRAPIVRVGIGYDDGSTESYRLVAANARDGLLVDPLPRSAADVAALFAGTLPAHASSLTLTTDERWFHAPAIAFDSVAFPR